MAQMLMKGETWKDALKLVRGQPRFGYPIMVEVKADEIRCRVTYDTSDGFEHVDFESFSGKPLYNMEHFEDHFLAYFRTGLYTELDIGIEVNGNFNDSYRWTQSSTGIPVEKFDKKTGKVSPALGISMVKIILFDLPESPSPFIDRLPAIDMQASGLRHYGLECVRPERRLCHTEAEVMQCYMEYRAAGHEGAMGKTLEHTYQRRRTFDWMKIKPSDTVDGKITGFNEAVSEAGEPLGRVGSINVLCEDGSTAAPAGVPHALGKELWENIDVYTGQWIEFQFMERDRAGGYRHPSYIRFREAKV